MPPPPPSNPILDFLAATSGGTGASPWAGIGTALKLILETSFLWLPIFLIYGAIKLFVTYKQAAFIHAQKSTLLEAKLPAEILKSPIGMEIFLTSLFQTGGEVTWIDRLIKGKSRPWFSLEIVSLEGKVKFFIWTRPAWKDHIESQIYAQFPGIEVNEVPDYTLPVKFDPEKNTLWGCELKLNKPDPYPIRTYVDYGLDKTLGSPRLESTAHASDPISAVIEFLGSLGPGEQSWIQILIRAHKKDRALAKKVIYNPLTWFEKADWKQTFKAEVDKITAKEKEGKKLSKADSETIEALERSISKHPFETGIRLVYLADKERYNPIRISGLVGSFRQFSSNNLNGFAPTRSTNFDYPWQDYDNIRLNGKRRSTLDAFKRRALFFSPYKHNHFILNTEELATVFHFPGASVTTPSLERVTSKKGEPPANLPI